MVLAWPFNSDTAVKDLRRSQNDHRDNGHSLGPPDTTQKNKTKYKNRIMFGPKVDECK
jgi:hypothetical protein